MFLDFNFARCKNEDMQNEPMPPAESNEVAAIRDQLENCRSCLTSYGQMISSIGKEITVASLALETLVARQVAAPSVPVSPPSEQGLERSAQPHCEEPSPHAEGKVGFSPLS